MPVTLRNIMRILVYGGCACTVLFCVFSVFLAAPFGGSRFELIEVAGAAAKARLDRFGLWPASVDPQDVESVTWISQSTIDSHSSWYRVKLTPDAASSWMNNIHEQQELDSRQSLDHLDEGLEGVHRSLPGSPPQHRQTGKTPTWWTPPPIEFRATEVMTWYRHDNSGYGRATYSAFDVSNGLLWIYEYGAQHDLLWSRGDVPPGQVFSTKH